MELAKCKIFIFLIFCFKPFVKRTVKKTIFGQNVSKEKPKMKPHDEILVFSLRERIISHGSSHCGGASRGLNMRAGV